MKIIRPLQAVIFLLANSALFGQCIADAGPEELHFCMGDNSSQLNGVASGGQAPYTYKWSMKTDTFQLGSGLRYYYASDYLSDTTIANPELISYADSSLIFYLEVTDANFTTCFDTITVTSSVFTHYLVTYVFHISKGDSVEFFGPQSGSNYGTDSIFWYPSHSLSNPNHFMPKASPDTTTTYGYILWDSKGCADTTKISTIVYVDAMSSPSTEVAKVEIYPTKLSSSGQLNIINTTEEILDFHLMDIQGREILHKRITRGKTRVEIPHLAEGVYFYSLSYNGAEMKSGKILVEE